VFAFEKNDFGVMYRILDALLVMGADRHRRDQSGLSAYDHARILKLDAGVVDMLNPFVDNRSDAAYLVLEAIRKGKHAGAAVCLTKTIPAHKLDEADQSPLALAIHFENAAIIPDLLEVGFSPFGGYVTDEAYYPSMAYNILSGSNRNLSLESTLRTWLSAKLRLRGREKVLRLYTDTVRLALDVMWGPLREVGKLYTHPYSGDRLKHTPW
jgi:hypothetical protein